MSRGRLPHRRLLLRIAPSVHHECPDPLATAAFAPSPLDRPVGIRRFDLQIEGTLSSLCCRSRRVRNVRFAWLWRRLLTTDDGRSVTLPSPTNRLNRFDAAKAAKLDSVRHLSLLNSRTPVACARGVFVIAQRKTGSGSPHRKPPTGFDRFRKCCAIEDQIAPRHSASFYISL
jgi:hypothetical protein